VVPGTAVSPGSVVVVVVVGAVTADESVAGVPAVTWPDWRRFAAVAASSRLAFT
jgi:hypothetical protein